MIKSLIILLFSFLLFSCNQKKASKEKESITSEKVIDSKPCNITATKTITKEDISLSIYNFNNLEPLLNQDCEDIHVINFWATWCPVTLISLDLPNLIESKLIPFIQEEGLKSNVIVLDDPDANSWIPKVDKDWSGAIPATIIIKGNKRKFYEQSFTYETLNEAINTL